MISPRNIGFRLCCCHCCHSDHRNALGVDLGHHSDEVVEGRSGRHTGLEEQHNGRHSALGEAHDHRSDVVAGHVHHSAWGEVHP